MFDEIKKRIREIGVLETSRRTGISRSRINDFVVSNRAMNSDNLEKVMKALFFSITNTVSKSIDSVGSIPCDPLKRDIIAAISMIIEKNLKPNHIYLIGPQAKGNWTKKAALEFLVVLEDGSEKVDVSPLIHNEGINCEFILTLMTKSEFNTEKELATERYSKLFKYRTSIHV